MSAQLEQIHYDRHGRMKYHSQYHPNHRKPFNESDLEYLCKYWEHDSARSLAFALGKTEHTIRQKVYTLKKKGLFEHYKNLDKHW